MNANRETTRRITPLIVLIILLGEIIFATHDRVPRGTYNSGGETTMFERTERGRKFEGGERTDCEGGGDGLNGTGMGHGGGK